MKNSIWFKAKKYGWGWTPSSWQGWVSTALFIVFTVLPAFIFLEVLKDYVWEYVVYTCTLSGAFVFLCYKKGEKPEWRWGDKE